VMYVLEINIHSGQPKKGGAVVATKALFGSLFDCDVWNVVF